MTNDQKLMLKAKLNLLMAKLIELEFKYSVDEINEIEYEIKSSELTPAIADIIEVIGHD